MKCPICNIDLLMSEKQGIEIDYCPACRGVWLDRGELEKIIERTINSENLSGQYSTENNEHYNRSHESDRHDSHGNRYGKKRNFLSDLFD